MSAPTQELRIANLRGPRGYGIINVMLASCDPTKLKVIWGDDNGPVACKLVQLPVVSDVSLDAMLDTSFPRDPADTTGATPLIGTGGIEDEDTLIFNLATKTWRNGKFSISNIQVPPTYTDPISGATVNTQGMVMTSDGAGGSTWTVPPGGYTFGTGAFGTYQFSAGTVAPGTIAQYGMPIPPQGWMPCDGAAYSRTTYFRLFNAIGTSFGVGDGSTTYNVPNMPSIPSGGGTMYYAIRY